MRAKLIKNLKEQVLFKLHNKDGEHIADYTPDFCYYSIELDSLVAEETKGSSFQHSATRQDYLLRVKWFLSENKSYRFFELIGGKKGFVVNEYVLKTDKNDKIYLRKIKNVRL